MNLEVLTHARLRVSIPRTRPGALRWNAFGKGDAARVPPPTRSSMQVLFDVFPVIVFFVVYRLQGIYAATAAIIATMALQIAYQWFRHGKVNKMFLASGIVVTLLGGITLALRNPLFIQWKPTIVNWLFAAAFLGSQVIGDKTLVERVMGHAVQLDGRFWRQLNLMWVAAFAALGAANLYVVYHFSESVWVNFKLFGMTGLLLLVAVGQAVWIGVRTAPVGTRVEANEPRSEE
jgi:intracellular septation protein